MNETTAHALRSDFHCALLWIRSMEVAAGKTQHVAWIASFVKEIDDHELFRTYVSPIKA